MIIERDLLKFIFSFFLISLPLSGYSQVNDAELIYQETNISLKSGKLYKNLSYEIKINNRAGEKFTIISIPYSKLIKISQLEAYIKDNRGTTVKKLQKGDITDKSAISNSSLYEDDFVKEFTLKHNSYPYSIVYNYRLEEEEFIYIESWRPVIDRKIPTHKAVLKFEVPVDYKVSFKDHLIDNFSVDTTNSQVSYSWTASYKDILEPEYYSPPFSTFMPYVKIVPVNFMYDLPGSFENWLEFGNWTNDLLNGLSDLPQSEKDNILQIIRGIKDTKEKVKRLYKYLQDRTRYINVTIETGGLKPYPASYVAENKYGDCKALSNYFKAVLEIVGIESFYSIVNAGDPKNNIDKNFPSQQFNHVILCVPVQGDTIWLDCTSDLPFSYLGTFTQDRDVFIVEKNKSHFTRTPALSLADVLESRKINIHQNLQNQAIAIFNNFYRGEKYELLFYLSHSINESDKSQIFRNDIVDDGFELIDFEISDSLPDTPEILLSYSARSNNVYNVYGNDLLINVLHFSFPKFEDPKERRKPIQIDYPVFKTDTLEYEIPIGYSASGDLLDRSITSEFGSYKIETLQNGKKVEIIKSFILNPGIYTVDRYKDFYEFIRSVNEIEKNNKILTIKQY